MSTRIEEQVVPGKRLGRNLNHDPRSRSYRVQAATPQSVRWTRRTPILDQGNLGSCVGNASVGVLGSDPFFATITPHIAALDETLAVKVYGEATKLDSFPGTYPPDDTGTDGLSGAKACQQFGYISGYVHAFSFDDFLAGMQTGPAITGLTWLTGCDNPDALGVVKYEGKVRGGHEVEADEVDVSAELVGFCNSWGRGWGLAGRFYMSFADYTKALADSGDATFFLPTTQPAPTPTPTPVPDKGLTRTFASQQDIDYLASFANRHPTWNVSKAWERAT